MDLLHDWIVPAQISCEAWVYIVTAVTAVAITSVSKGGFGGGVGMISVPLMLQVAPVKFVLGLWLPVLIACDLATIHRYPKEWNPRLVLHLVPGVFLGIAAAAILLGRMDTSTESAQAQEAWLKLGVALIAVVFVGLRYATKAKQEDKGWQPTWKAGLPIGLLAGVTTTLAHAAGPIVTMFILMQNPEKRVFVGTTGRFYFTFNSLKVPFMIAVGVVTAVTFRYGLWLMLLAPLGVWCGSRLNRRLSAVWFTHLIELFLVLVSGKLVYDWWRIVFILS